MKRRDLLAGVLGTMMGVTVGQKPLPHRPLGKTGVKVPILAVGGGSAFCAMPDGEAERFLYRALQLNLTYWDTAYVYGGGISEKRMGHILKTERDHVFLATKVTARTYDGAMRQVETSLKRLQTDRIDLLQIHDWKPHDDVFAVARKGGVLTALRKLRDEKVVRFIGLTGHSMPTGIGKFLEIYDDIDTVLLPINPSQPEFETQVIPIARKKGIGVLGMKVLGARRLLPKASPEALLRYAWSAPITTAIIGMTSIALLERNAHLAKFFSPLDPKGREQLRHHLSALQGSLPYLATDYRDDGVDGVIPRRYS